MNLLTILLGLILISVAVLYIKTLISTIRSEHNTQTLAMKSFAQILGIGIVIVTFFYINLAMSVVEQKTSSRQSVNKKIYIEEIIDNFIASNFQIKKEKPKKHRGKKNKRRSSSALQENTVDLLSEINSSKRNMGTHYSVNTWNNLPNPFIYKQQQQTIYSGSNGAQLGLLAISSENKKRMANQYSNVASVMKPMSRFSSNHSQPFFGPNDLNGTKNGLEGDDELIDPHIDPTGDPIPIAESNWFLLLLAIGYALVRRKKQ